MHSFIKGMRRQVGWFVIVGIGTIVLLLSATILRTDLFSDKFNISFSPPSAGAFYVGQPVQFQGFTIGRVDDMDLLDEGKVEVKLRLLDRYRDMLHQGAVVRIVKKGLIGEQVVEVTAGDTRQPIVIGGQQLPYETQASIEQLLLDLKPAVANADTLLKELVVISKWVNDPDGSVRQLVSNLTEASSGIHKADLEAITQRFIALLTALQTISSEFEQQHVALNLSSALQAATQLMHDLEPFTNKIGKQGPALVLQTNSMFKHVDQLSQSLNSVAKDLGELTPELPGLARDSRKTIVEMQGMLQGLQSSWPFNVNDTDRDTNAVAVPAMDFRP